MKSESNTLVLHRFDGIEKYKIKESHFLFEDDDSLPLNGQLINGKKLDITLYFSNQVKSSETSFGCESPNIFIEIDATKEKLESFHKVGDSIRFSDYICSDEWEVMATLYCYSHINIRDCEITIVHISKSSITISINGKICDPNYGNSKPDTQFYTVAEIRT